MFNVTCRECLYLWEIHVDGLVDIRVLLDDVSDLRHYLSVELTQLTHIKIFLLKNARNWNSHEMETIQKHFLFHMYMYIYMYPRTVAIYYHELKSAYFFLQVLHLLHVNVHECARQWKPPMITSSFVSPLDFLADLNSLAYFEFWNKWYHSTIWKLFQCRVMRKYLVHFGKQSDLPFSGH